MENTLKSHPNLCRYIIRHPFFGEIGKIKEINEERIFSFSIYIVDMKINLL